MSADELLAKALRKVETCLSVNNNSCGKLASSLESPIMLGDNLNITSVSFFIANFNLVVANLVTLDLNYYIASFYTDKNQKL